MATRLQTDFYSEAGNKYTVFIDDADFVGTASSFDAYGLSLNYSGHNGERFNPILTSDLTLSIQINDATLDTFVSDLVGAADLRFRVKVNKNDSLFWVGVVKTDSITIEDKPYPFNFTLAATDGIGLLKDQDYNDNEIAITGIQLFIDHVFNILERIGVNDFFGASDPYVQTINDWREKTIFYSTGTDPWEYSGTGYVAFYTQDGEDKKYMSCYDVLVHICTTFGMRLLFSDGAFRFIQVNEQANGGGVVLRTFDKSQNITVTVDTSLAGWDKLVGEYEQVKAGTHDLYKITSGGYQYFPALNKVTVAYAHNSTGNHVRYDDITTSTVISDIDYNGGAAILAFQASIAYSPDFPTTFEYHYAKFRVEIEIGGYYLRRTHTYNGSTGQLIASPVTWSTTQSYYEVLVYVSQEYQNYATIGFISPPLPVSGDLTIQVTYLESYYINGGSVIGAPYSLNWNLDDAYLEIFADGSVDGQTNTSYYSAENDTTGNSSELDITTVLGGTTHPNAFGRMFIMTAGFIVTQQWQRGATGTLLNIQQLLANEIIYGQLSPVEKMVSQSFWGDYAAHETLVRNSKNYILLGGSLDMKKEIWSGDWFYIAVATSGTTPGTTVESGEIIIGNADINLSAPSNQTPGMAILSISDEVIVKPHADPENALIIKTTVDLTELTEYEEIGIPVMNPGDLFIEGDSVVVKNPVTGEEQAFTTSKIGHDGGNDAILVDFEAANYDFNAGSSVVPDPLEQQYNITFGRRKFMNFHLVDLTTDFTTSTSFITFEKFFRPPGSTTSSDSTDFVNRVYLRKVHWLIGDNPSASASINYTARVVRGSTPDVVSTTTIYGTTNALTVDIENGEQLLHNDTYKFQIKKDDASGLAENTGLVCMLEMFNKVFEPSDIIDIFTWLRPDYNVTVDGSNGVSTWGDAFGSNDFVQATAGSRPIFTEHLANGYPGMVFNNDFVYIVAGIDPTATNFSIHIAFNSGTLDAINGNTILAQFDGASNYKFLNINVAARRNVRAHFPASNYKFLNINTSGELESTLGGVTLIGNTLTADTNYIASLVFDGTNQYIYINAVYEGGNTPTPGGTPANIYLGKFFSGSGYFRGTVYELIIYDTYLESTRRELVENYLSRKFNIPLG